MRRTIITVLLGLTVIWAVSMYGRKPATVSALAVAKCTGDPNCSICKSCKSCLHCKNGGVCGACSGEKPARQYREGYCERVIDGDTIVVFQKGKDLTVRLIGVDTPETKDPRKPIQFMGKEATQYTTSVVLGKPVILRSDPSTGVVDRYGRMLAYVEVGGVLLNREIIRQGYGHAYVKYPFDPQRMDEFRAAEKEARDNKRGLWK